MNNIINSIKNIGIKNHYSDELKHHIHISNIFNLVLIILTFPYLFIYKNVSFLFLLSSVTILFYTGSLLLTGFNKHKTGRFIFSIAGATSVYLVNLFVNIDSPADNMAAKFIMLGTIIFPFVVFEAKDLKYSLIGISIIFVYLFSFDAVNDFRELRILTIEFDSSIFRKFSVFVAFLGISGVFYMYKKQLARTTTELLETNDKLYNKNSELKAIEEELRHNNEELISSNEEKETQKQIIEGNELRLKTIIDNQGEGFGITDFNENFIFTNPKACEIFGVPNGKLKGKNLREFVDDDEWNRILKQTSIRKNNKRSNYELKVNMPNKEIKHLLVTATPDKNKFGIVKGTLGTFIDYTARKKEKEELTEMNNTKDKFFSIIAHDLRGPFNSILGFSELLLNDFDAYDTQKQKDFIEIIHKGAKNTFKLIENLLIWSRAQSGVIPFNPIRYSLFLFADETIELLESSAKDKSITLINNISEEVNVKADKDMLSAILRNLISNAIKFTPKGGKIILTERLLRKKGKQNFVEITVEDSGIGISKEKLSKLFLLSESISTLGTEKEPGTGLGLLLCKEFVKIHKGKIWAESEESKGSKFIFTLPEN